MRFSALTRRRWTRLSSTIHLSEEPFAALEFGAVLLVIRVALVRQHVSERRIGSQFRRRISRLISEWSGTPPRGLRRV